MTPHTRKMLHAANLKFTGATILCVSFLTADECENLGWDQGTFALSLKLKDGTSVVVYPSQDDEGNGPGALFTTHQDFQTLWVDKP